MAIKIKEKKFKDNKGKEQTIPEGVDCPDIYEFIYNLTYKTFNELVTKSYNRFLALETFNSRQCSFCASFIQSCPYCPLDYYSMNSNGSRICDIVISHSDIAVGKIDLSTIPATEAVKGIRDFFTEEHFLEWKQYVAKVITQQIKRAC